MSGRKIYKLSNSLIANIAKVIQLAILTGTDITDHFKMMRLEARRDDPSTLELTKECEEQQDKNVEKMMEEIERVIDSPPPTPPPGQANPFTVKGDSADVVFVTSDDKKKGYGPN